MGNKDTSVKAAACSDRLPASLHFFVVGGQMEINTLCLTSIFRDEGEESCSAAEWEILSIGSARFSPRDLHCKGLR